MPRVRRLRGNAVQGDAPRWEPLLAVVGEDGAADFMWMFEVRLDDGRRLDAYKHIGTRGYLHLDDEGNAFVYAAPDTYEPWDVQDLLRAVLAR